MQLILAGDLIDRLEPFDCFQGNLEFELVAVLSVFWSLGARKTCQETVVQTVSLHRTN
jgi:hypothetical protein